MDMRLSGKVAVVTGAGSGIGYATVESFLAEGCRVVGVDIDGESLDRLTCDDFLAVTADLSRPDAAGLVLAATLKRFQAIDILVNNVGVFPYRGGFLKTDMGSWRTLFDINFFSVVSMNQAVIPAMIDRGGGAIVSVTSDMARQPDYRLVDYSASKAALLNLTKSIANEFGAAGIRSNAVAPGPTFTAQWQGEEGFAARLAAEYGLSEDQAIEHFARDVRRMPTGRIGQPSEVAGIVLWLASDVTAQVTGSEYPINGGVYVAA